MAGELLLALIADIIWRLPIANIPWPGPIDGILRRVPMADVVGLILRSLKEVLKSMENDHGVRREGGFIRRINTLKRVVFAANFRQSYVAEAYQGRGERLRNEHHRSMARLLHEIIEGDYRCREALYDPRRHLESVGNRHIRRRNKQRRRRAQRRWIQAKGHLESCIRKLIREAMLYHLICEIEEEQGRSFQFSVVSREIDVRVIEVMITLFPHLLFMVTSCIDLVKRFQHYDALPEIQDGDGPWKYWLFRTPVAGFFLYLTMLVYTFIVLIPFFFFPFFVFFFFFFFPFLKDPNCFG
ncbi:hypothetical protein ACJW30_03G147100 [Castanea mollissima]